MSRVIMVTSFKGGVGKTTVSANLSMSLAQMGYKVAAIDCDIESRCLDIMLGLEDASLYNICDVLNGSKTLDDVIVRDIRCDNLSFIAAPAYFSFADKEKELPFNEKQVEQFILELKKRFDFVILDLPARPDGLYKTLVQYSNFALVVSLHTAASIRAAEKTAMTIEDLVENSENTVNFGRNLKTRLVINCFHAKDVIDGVRPSIYDIINKVSVKLIGVLPYDSGMSKGQELGLLAYQVKHGKTPFYAAINNTAKRCTEKSVPLLENVKLDVNKSRLS